MLLTDSSERIGRPVLDRVGIMTVLRACVGTVAALVMTAWSIPPSSVAAVQVGILMHIGKESLRTVSSASKTGKTQIDEAIATDLSLSPGDVPADWKSDHQAGQCINGAGSDPRAPYLW